MKLSSIILISLFAVSPCVGAAKKILERSALAVKQKDTFKRLLLVHGKEVEVKSHFRIPTNSHSHIVALETGDFLPLETVLCDHAMKSQAFRSKYRGSLGLAAGLTAGSLLGGYLGMRASDEELAEKLDAQLSKGTIH